MRKIILLSIAILFSFTAFSQDFSNKGKEFWLCFPNHIPSGNVVGQMTIWITSDQASSGTVTITNGSFPAIPFTVAANGIVPISIPHNLAHIFNAESGLIIQKSIKIKVDAGQPAVVAYVQQYGNARSAATLLLPTNVLGKKYRAFSFTHFASQGTGGAGQPTQNSRSQFQIIATQPNTQVEITPFVNGVKGTTFTIVFPNAGDLYQYQAQSDVTGTLIESIAIGSNPCLPIAVFSGNSAVTIGSTGPSCNGGSVDPLFQQMYPVSSWGKNFGFIPFGDYTTRGNPYRVMASEDNTNVYFNGIVVANLNAGQIYAGAAPFTSNPVLLNSVTSITANKPISVAHYLQTSACSGSNNGDPDMVMLNPIEQNIKDITVFASTQQNINRQWINVLIKTAAAGSFKIDGLAPTTAFVPATNIPGYSYLRHLFTPTVNGSHYLSADSGFNAILYGYQGGQFESYAYSAGTNVKDLSQQLEIETTYGIETSPSVCTNSPFKIKVYFPDSTLSSNPIAIRFDSLRWSLSNSSIIVPNNFPIVYYGSVGSPPKVAIDSINIRNGRQVAWYSLPSTYYFNTAAVDTLFVTGYTSTNEGCGSTKDYVFPIQINDPSIASFNAPAPGCYLVPVVATETTPQIPKPTYRQWWEFYDPVTNLTTVYAGNAVRVATHTFTTPGVKRIRHSSITTPGCLSDTIVQNITLPDIPTATLSGSTTVCINAPNPTLTVNFFDGRAPWRFRYSINGTIQPDVVTSSNPYIINANTTVANTFIYRLEQVQNDGSTFCVSTPINQIHTVIVQPNATVTLRAGDDANPTVCINNAIPSIRYDLGGTFTNATVSGLPAGVTYTFAGGIITISGTPTVFGTFPYVILPVGPCLVPVPPVGGTITVDNDATIALTSAVGTDNQTKCINTLIINIDYLVAGGGTGATIAWVPSVPTGIVFTPLGGNNFRISGTPSVSGTFNYTISTTGPCIKPTATGSLTIQPDATVTLRAGDDANPTVCINNAIPSIRYDLGGTFTNATVSGLPAGVTYTFAGGIITISGTPTVFGTFPYVILPVGPCLVPVPPVGGTITVDNDATIALTSAVGTDNQTKCINTLIINIDYLVAGGGTGATIAWVPSVPTGIVFTPLGGNNFRISGTPSVSGTFNYTISTTGPCIKPTVTGSLTVTPDATVTLTTANNNQTVCVNNVIATIRYTIGGSGNGGSVSGLPAGVTGTYAGGIITISGTPTVSGVFNFIINPTGPCAFPIPALGGTLTVTGDATIALTTAIGTDNQIRCRNVAIANIEYFVGGTGTGATIAWVPSVPTGIVFTPLGGNNFRISGTPTVSGTFNYTISTTGPCVKPTANGTIVVNQLPVASYTFTTPSCANNTINFTNTTNPNAAGVSTWAWNFGDPASGAANTSALFNPSHTFALPGGYNVTLNAVNSNGCISDPNAIQNVLVNDTPRAGFIIPEVCLSDTYAQFLDTSRIATGAIISWLWYFDDPNATVANPNVSTLQNPTHSYTAVGIYDSVQLIVTSALGCRDTILQSLTVNGSFPVANFTVNNPATLCANDSVAIVEASTVFPGVITKIEIYWDNTNFPGVFQIDNNPFSGKIYRHLYPNFQAPLTKIFTIRYRAYSGGVCVNDKLKNITVNAAPLVQFNAMPNSCLLIPPFQITQVSEIGGVPGIGVYSGPGVSSTGLFTPGIAGIGTHTILYTFTSTAGGCVDTMSNRITVLDTAHATFSYVTPTCQGVPVSFTDLSTAPSGVVLANTVWDFGDGSGLQNFAPGSTFTHAFPGVGNYTVRMYNVSAAGCLSRDTSAVITIKPNHTITLTGANNVQTVCINAPLNPIIYTLGGGANNATVSGLPAGITASVTGITLTIQGSPTTTVASPFNFTITTTGNDCIIATASGIITVQPDHTIVLATGNTNQSVCVNTPIDDITYTIGGGAAGFTVTGLPPGVTSAITGNTITISGTPTTTAGGPIFNFSITTTGNTCLTANAIGSIKVNPYPVPTFTPDKPVYCIPVATVKFNNGSTMPDGTGMTYVWDFDDVASGTLNTSTALSPTHFFAIQRTYDVRLTATSLAVLNGGAIGCTRDVVIPLTTIKAQPKAAFTTNKPSVCIADDVIFTDLSDPTVGATTVSRFWDFDGDGTFEPANPNPTVTYTYPMAGTFAPTLYIVNSFGCHSDTLPKVFTVFPYPTVDAGVNKTILEFGSVTLNPTVTGDVTDYLWTPNIYFNNNNRVKQPTASNIKDDVTYKLTVTSRSGCTVSDDVSIKVLRFPKIPNTFTPNNDGINDKWVIEYLNSYPNCRVQVFSRTGQLVFESKGYGTPWNGTLKGKQLPVDTYYYIIEPQANRDPITGYVTIVK